MISDLIPICCSQNAVWVENIPGKGYHFCKSCRKEVLTPLEISDKVSTVFQTFDKEYEDILESLWMS